jgi:hypothetical protein
VPPITVSESDPPQHYGIESSLSYVWDVATLSWVRGTAGGGGGGGAVTVADGADVAQGSTGDAAWVAGAGTVISLLKKIASAGGSAVSIADAADVVEGALADAAVVTDANGTVSGKLRGLVKWAFERMPASLGQKTMAASFPVTLASNQGAVGVSILTSPLDVQQVGGTPWGVTDAGGSLTVDGVFFQATQPVSAAALPLPAGAATSALQTQPGVDIGDVTINNGAAGAAVNIQDGGNSITVDGTVTTTPPANASTNVAQLAGTATSVNSGTKDAGTLRVVLATDQPALTNKLLVTPDSVALPANQSVNVAQFGASAVVTGTGAGGAGIPRVTVSSDSALATVTTVTTVAAVTAITNALPTGANIIGSVNGDVDHDVANTLKNIQVGGNATPVDVPPTLVSANGDRVRAWFDRAGAQVVRRRKLRESFTAVCRLAETTARLDPTFTFTANTNKQLVTLHHAATATKELRIQKVTIIPTLLGTAAGLTMFEIRYITGTPATGNPAITPQKHQQAAGATEAVVLVLPTTGGTDSTPNSPLASWIIDHGIEAATGPTTNPMPVAPEIVLYDASAEDDEMLPITLRVGTLEGIAIVGRSTAAVVLRFFAIIKYTEEIP